MLNRLAEQWMASPALQLLVEQQLGVLCAALLVGARLTGVFFIGPLFGQKVIPTHVRLLMIVFVVGTAMFALLVTVLAVPVPIVSYWSHS